MDIGKVVELPFGGEGDRIERFRALWELCDERDRRTIVDMVNRVEDWTKTPPCPVKRIVALYHTELPMLRRIKMWTPQRDSHLRARWSQMPDIGEWTAYFRLVAGTPFLIGKGRPNDQGRIFKADFDYLINPNKFAYILEGKYDD